MSICYTVNEWFQNFFAYPKAYILESSRSVGTTTPRNPGQGSVDCLSGEEFWELYFHPFGRPRLGERCKKASVETNVRKENQNTVSTKRGFLVRLLLRHINKSNVITSFRAFACFYVSVISSIGKSRKKSHHGRPRKPQDRWLPLPPSAIG